MVKRSFISKAWISTLLGVLIGVITSAATMYTQGTFSWEAVLAGFIPAFLLAVTDILSEVKKEIDTKPE